MAPRIPLPTDRLNFLGIPDTSALCPDLNPALGRYYQAIVTLGGVDPVTTELVRLRNAQIQSCNLWMSIRDAVASQHGANEEVLAKVDGYEASDLPDGQKAALRLADVYLSSPGLPSEELREELGRHFTGIQLVEILLRLMQCNSDKTMVALGLDTDEVHIFTMDRPDH